MVAQALAHLEPVTDVQDDEIKGFASGRLVT
jgi:hypothetical protein